MNKRRVGRYHLTIAPGLLLGSYILCLMLVAGCTGDPHKRGGDGDRASSVYWVAKAQQHELLGDLQRARHEYRIALTLSPYDHDIKHRIDKVDQAIRSAIRDLEKTAGKAQRKGQAERAQRLYLDLLSLDPFNQQALFALRAMDEHQAKKRLQAKYPLRPSKSRKPQDEQELRDEDYAYSRQSILQADERARDAASFIRELEAHVTKYPQDDELRNMLLNLRISKARQAFQRKNYDLALSELQRGEKFMQGDPKGLATLGEKRKGYAKTLYLDGVRRVRESRDEAVALWQAALKFDPQDKKIQLRIRNSKLQ
ncbi:MAG: hypothetical protein ABW101_01480 [Candidatus Thiodiazotropha sp.]